MPSLLSQLNVGRAEALANETEDEEMGREVDPATLEDVPDSEGEFRPPDADADAEDDWTGLAELLAVAVVLDATDGGVADDSVSEVLAKTDCEAETLCKTLDEVDPIPPGELDARTELEAIRVDEASALLEEDTSDSGWLVAEDEDACTRVDPAEEGVSTMYVPDTLPEGNTVDTVVGPDIEL